MATQTQELFASKISIESPTGCWTWRGTIGREGYGVFAWSKNRMSAHRYSWTWFNGRPVPPEMMVLHNCHNPACVNPLHLKLGTHEDNMSDRKLIGNYLRGEKHVNSVVSDARARSIFDDQRTCGAIAKTFGVSRHVVQGIRSGKTYINATGGGRSPYQGSKGKGSWNTRYPVVPWGKIKKKADA